MDYGQIAVFLSRYTPVLAQGLLLTLALSALAAPAAMAWGTALALPRIWKRPFLSAISLSYVEIMRNTPLLVQLYLLYFGLPLLGIFWSSFVCGVIAIALQHGAFLSEIIRSGVESISGKQWEAAKSIGMRRTQALRLVILPQATMKVMPSIANQLVILVKDTSVVSGIGVLELTLSGKLIIDRSGASYESFIAVAICYLLLTTTLGAAFRFLELRTVGRF